MKPLFFPRLAWTGIKNNRRLYLPYILTCIGVTAVFYIIHYLATGNVFENMRGGQSLSAILAFGFAVIAIFSLIFLFYTNSFLIRRRKKEFGLYNVLGMSKRNIGRVLFHESVIMGAISLFGGLVLGIALSKLCEMFLSDMLCTPADYSFRIPLKSVLTTVSVYIVIYFIIFLNSLRQLKFSKPTDLLHSENVGEKPPKANWVLGIGGVVLLAAAYIIAVSIKQPLAAIFWFFVAVIMVIVASYMIFISGSVLMCKILQKNKSYYYDPKHFVSVSGMAYRMKRNGAGLASICILATMVLVTISSTSCLYYGKEDSLNRSYPYDYTLTLYYDSLEAISDRETADIKGEIDDFMAQHGGMKDSVFFRSISIAGELNGSEFNFTPDADLTDSLGNVYYVHLISLSDYSVALGRDVELGGGKAIVLSEDFDKSISEFNLGDGLKYELIRADEDGMVNFGLDTAVISVGSLTMVVPDFDNAAERLMSLSDYNGYPAAELAWSYYFDSNLDSDAQIELADELWGIGEDIHSGGRSMGSRADAGADFFSTYSGLFFLGIMLSIVFLCGAVLIIYYKQISEGYEDQSRFDIMQKVGMTKQDIRRSINSQLLTVFFMPLLFAVLHLCFAFPLIEKLLMLFGVANLRLLIVTAAISALVFAVFYVIVYRVTSNAYYSIVSGAKE